MYSSEELKKRILSRLEGETVEEDNPEGTKCPFDCSSEFSMLHELGEDVDRLDSNVTTLGTEFWKIEAREHAITDLSSRYHNLQSDQRVKGEVERLKETARTHGERLDEDDKKLETLYALQPIIYENKAKIAKLEEHANDLDARLDDEKQQRKESDSNLWLGIGFLAFLWLLNRQRLAETQTAPPLLTPPVQEPAVVAARAYVAAKKFRR